MSNRVLLKKNKALQRLPYVIGASIVGKTVEATLIVGKIGQEVSIDLKVSNGGLEVTNEATGSFSLLVTQDHKNTLITGLGTFTSPPKVKVSLWVFNIDNSSYAQGSHDVGIEL